MKEIKKRWNIHQISCDWNRNRVYGNKVCDMNCENVFESVLGSEINLAVSKERKQFIDGLVKREETKFQDEHPVDCIDGVTPVETYGYEATYNQAKKETISHLKEIRKKIE